MDLQTLKNTVFSLGHKRATAIKWKHIVVTGIDPNSKRIIYKNALSDADDNKNTSSCTLDYFRRVFDIRQNFAA
jgi:hypothetical protein